MEALILGWYILTATGSVAWLVAFGALMWSGSVFAPFLGIAGDRIGLRALLCITRGGYALFAAILTALIIAEALEPWHIFVIYGIAGLVRPSDQALRNVLLAQTMRPDTLMGAMGLSRTTADIAKILGAFAGASGVALVGMAPAYAIVTALYLCAFLLSLGVGRSVLVAAHATAHDVIAGITEAVHYMWGKPDLLGAFAIAFLVNLLAYPFVLSLLPYAAKEVYAVGQSGLGYLAAAFALGALFGSIVVGAGRMRLPAGRVMLWSTAVWFLATLLFGLTRSLPLGVAFLFVAGFAQSFSLIPVSVVMLRASSEAMRGRVMGMRVLAVWGLPLGVLAAGPIIVGFGYTACAILYSFIGVAATLMIGYRLRQALWRPSAAANAAP
jgi:predicted MFS family arabinose efflux permease